MSKNAVYDKRMVVGLLIGCAAAIIIFHFAWINHFLHNLANPVFTIVYGALFAADIIEAIGAWRYQDDETKDWKRYVVAILTAALIFWLGIWASGKNEDKMFRDDVEKAKQSAFMQNYKERSGGMVVYCENYFYKIEYLPGNRECRRFGSKSIDKP